MDGKPDIRALQALYQRYLQESVNLAEEVASLQVQLQDAQEALQEARGDQGGAEATA